MQNESNTNQLSAGSNDNEIQNCPFIVQDDLSEQDNAESLETVALPEVADTDSPKQLDSEETVECLLLAAHSLRGMLSEHLAKYGLNDIRYAVLKLIADSSPDGCSQAELARHLRQSESSISTLVDRMRSSHLVYRLRSKQDRRKRVLMLTEQGQEMLSQARASYRQQVDQLMGWTDSDEQTQFAETLERIVKRLESPITQEETSPLPANVFGITPQHEEGPSAEVESVGPVNSDDGESQSPAAAA